jgi:formate/nitrite transporter
MAERGRSVKFVRVNSTPTQSAAPAFPVGGVDALPPAEIARKAETIGEAKARMRITTVFALAVLAGAFIALGAIFSTTVAAGASDLPYGVVRLLAGITFSLGLMLVVVAGAELFTGNNLIVMAWASRRIPTARLLVNWGIVYVGNFVGAVATAGLMYATRQYTFGGGEVGQTALTIATTKVGYGFFQAIALGILCNALVCLAVWLTYGAHTVTDKIVAVLPPIAAFVAAGFEHSVANMYFIPYGLFVKHDAAWVSSTADIPDTAGLTWRAFFVDNLLPVTIGNVIGGALLVGAVYWFVYLRQPSADEREHR